MAVSCRILAPGDEFEIVLGFTDVVRPVKGIARFIYFIPHHSMQGFLRTLLGLSASLPVADPFCHLNALHGGTFGNRHWCCRRNHLTPSWSLPYA